MPVQPAAADEIDFSNLDIAHNKKAIQLARMADATFDSWQELDHCKDEFFAIAIKDHPDDYRGDSMLLMCFISQR